MRQKNKIINSLIIAFIVLFTGISSVFAAGNATMSLTSNNTVTNGSNITVTLNVTTNTFATLKYKVYEGLPSDLTHSSTAKIAKTAFFMICSTMYVN